MQVSAAVASVVVVVVTTVAVANVANAVVASAVAVARNNPPTHFSLKPVPFSGTGFFCYICKTDIEISC